MAIHDTENRQIKGKLVLEMKNICKSFPGVKALDNINFDVRSGEVHALLGENGAGKSTLIKILGGIYPADSGSIFIEGKEVHIADAHSAFLHGISIIHQELMILPELTIAENIFLGKQIMKNRFFIDSRTMNKETEKLLGDFDLHFSPTMKAKKLSIANQQMIEIIRAISFGARIIVMDEPTSSISEKEVAVLFETIRTLVSKNIAIIYISHRMNELGKITDRITVLRDGQYIGTVDTKDTTNTELISMMVGRKLTNYYTKDASHAGDVILKVSHLSDGELVRDVTFDLRRGEVLGFAGLIGAGRTELMRAIFGADSYEHGDVLLYGESIKGKSPKEIIRRGIGLIPEDRRGQGLLLEKTVRENTSLASLKENSHNGFIDFSWEKREAVSYIEKLRIKTPSDLAIIKNLSGGNQQKVVIAKWLLAKSKILIMDEPTRGIDVNAKAEIYELMKNFVEDGGSIILVSSELPEVLGCSNRIMVMREGYVTGFLDSAEATEENVMLFASKGNEEVAYE